MSNEIGVLNRKVNELEREILDLKQKQIAITEAKELYLKIFEEFPALIWRSRLDKLCDYFNKTWLDFTGRTMEQEFGNGWAEGVHPDDFNFCVQTYVTAFDKRESFLMDYRMKNKHGEYRWIRDFGRPFYDLDNTFLGYIGSCYDITDNVNNELKLIELNATKDKFFSIIAHDLKSPFNSVIGLCEHLVEVAEERDYVAVKNSANVILQSSKRAMDLLMNLMVWSQSQTGRMKFNSENTDLVVIINEVILLLDFEADQKSLIIKKITPEKLFIKVDKAMISTVLRNLISNAIKFTNPGGNIIISLFEEPHQLTVSITDNGVGISEDKIGKLFRIDENFSTEGTQKEKGTGLGLILCKEFITKHNGRIWVESKPGIGSTFSFTIPC